jgi:protocatechuate 3,4-dioxygenase beta subunit
MIAVRMVLAVAALCSAALGISPQNPRRDAPTSLEGTAGIRGRVVAADTGAALRGARVLVTDTAGTEQSSATDAEGAFEFTKLSAGQYRIRVQPGPTGARYLVQDYPAGATGGQRRINLAAGQVLERIMIKLPRASAIAGRVTDEYGDPLAFARISIMERLPGGRRRAANSAPALQMTDDHGRYRIFGLRAGEYLLEVDPRRVEVTGAGPMTQPMTTYYPGTINPAEAAAIRVAAGVDVAGIDVEVARGQTFRVSGSVVDSRGVPAANTVVLVERSTGDGGFTGRHTKTDRNGLFTVIDIMPGDQYVTARAALRTTDIAPGSELAVQPLSVYSDIEGLVITTRPGVTLSGTVSTQPPAGSIPQRARVVALYEGPSGAAPISSRAFSAIAPDGSFTIHHVHGPVLLRVTGVSDYWLRSVSVDRTDVTDKPTTFGQDVAGIRIDLTREGAQLTGTVSDADGRPVPEASVLIFGEAQDNWNGRFSSSRTAVTDADGQYRLRALRPGSYVVIALPGGTASLDGATPEFFQALADAGTSIALREDESRVLNLTIASIQ